MGGRCVRAESGARGAGGWKGGEALGKAMKMSPVEGVVGSICAGWMAKRDGLEEGLRLAEPIFEFFLKSDALHDPLCNDDHIRVLGWASAHEITAMKSLTHRVNEVLQPMFAEAGIDLVDYKLEFGHPVADPPGLVASDENPHFPHPRALLPQPTPHTSLPRLLG
mgnify:CR=1 FL=1